MTALLRKLVRSGIAIGNPFYPRSRYIRPRHGDAHGDFAAIAGDMRRMAADFRRTAARELTSYGEPAYKR